MKITSGKAVLAAEEHGSGPAVLLLHAGVTDKRSWRHVVDALPDNRCLTFDSRGYGETTYDVEDGWSRVDDAIAVLDAYGVDRAVVVACSMGGRTGLDLALTHPDRVRALVLIGSAVSGAPEIELEEDLQWLEGAFEQAEQAGDLDELNRLEALVWLDGPRAGEGRVTGEPRELFLEMNRVALEAADPGDERHDVNAWEQAGDIVAPTLVLIGEHDLGHTHANAERLAHTIPGARLVPLPGVAHLPHLENDPLTLREIASFVASVGGV
jgi:pimeloyl-ACP methyl ester carboxylesterase